jgi:c-di-GMP-related signal transduction protein
LRLLAALSKPDLTTAEVERLLEQDVSLSLRVLRSVNSAAYPIRTGVRSIGPALFLLGIEPIRKWASVWCLAGLSSVLAARCDAEPDDGRCARGVHERTPMGAGRRGRLKAAPT